jgi:hypothetical protein
VNTSWRIWRLSFYILLLGVLVACGSETAPTVTLTASSETITIGESSELSWVLSGDEPITLSLSPDIGVELTSPITVSPTETTTYTLTASNDAGSSSASVTIVVESAPVVNAPSVSLSASSETITLGQSSELSWMVSGDEPISLSISPDLGIDDLTSPVTVSPTETTTYILTASNDAGSTSASVTIVVESAPIISLAASSENLTMGQSSELSWIVSGSDPISLSISPDLGINDLTSPITVSPTETTTYTLTATNDIGSTSASVTVEVDYRVGENYELTDEAVVLSPALLDTILVSQDDTTMTLQGEIPEIEVGDVIVSILGEGAIRHVLGVSNEGDSVVLTTEQASITDAFVRLDFDISDATVELLETEVETNTPGVTLSLSLDGDGSEIETANSGLTLNASVKKDGFKVSEGRCFFVDGTWDYSFNPRASIGLERAVGDLTPTVVFDASINPTISAEARIESQFAINFSEDLYEEIKIPVMRYFNPWPPVVIIAELTVDGNAQVNAAGRFTTNVSGSASSEVSISRDVINGFDSDARILDAQDSADFSNIEVSMSSSLTPVEIGLWFQLYGVGGPFGSVGGRYIAQSVYDFDGIDGIRAKVDLEYFAKLGLKAKVPERLTTLLGYEEITGEIAAPEFKLSATEIFNAFFPSPSDSNIVVSDVGDSKDDIFQVAVNGDVLGSTERGGSGEFRIGALPPGFNELTLTTTADEDPPGTYGITLDGGITFADGTTQLSGGLPLNQSETFSLLVQGEECR